MKSLTYPLALVLLANSFFAAGSAKACGAGGGVRRPVIRNYATPAIRYAPAPRTIVVHQPIQTVRRVSVASPTVVRSSTVPQIRLAPTQVRSRSTIAPAQVVRQRTPAVATSPAMPTTLQSKPAAVSSTTSPSSTPDTSPSNGLSALAILSGKQAPTESAVPTKSSGLTIDSHVGIWTASANGRATITLSLNSDASFEWVAITNGKTQRFSGQFEIRGSKLSLSRSSDNQKLVGTLTFSGSGFNYKLEGAKDSGLDFARKS